MRPLSPRAGFLPALALAAAALVGCNTSQQSSKSNGGGSQSTPPVKEAQSNVQEAQKMRGHGEQLKAQGDETGGDRLIEQAKVKEAQGKVQMEKAQKPQTQPH